MTSPRSIVTRSTAPLAAVLLIVPLVACGGGGGSMTAPPPVTPPAPTLPTGVDKGSSGSPSDPLAAFTAQVTFQPTPHQGLEIVNVTAISDGVLNTTPETNPTLTLGRTTTGFDMTLSQGLVRYDTRGSGPSQSNTFDGCVNNEQCTGSGMGLNRVQTKFNSGAASTLSYSSYGAWYKTGGVAIVNGYGAFATGLPSTTAQVPTTGTGTYTGGASGFVVIDIGLDSRIFNGTASLNADFAGRTISGSITNITTDTIIGNPQPGTLANIMLNNGTISGTAFTGTAMGTTAAGSHVDLTGLSGQFGGAFYGPNANEVAGSFALTGTGFSVIGAFGAKR